MGRLLRLAARHGLLPGLFLLVLALASPAPAAEWPTGPIRVVVGASPGGGTDIIMRIIGEPLGEVLGQPIVIENKPGAASMIAGGTVAKAAKDGDTAYMMNNAHTVLAAVYKSLPFDPVDDFAFVSLTAKVGLVLVANPKLKASSVKELIAAAKAAPGKLNLGSMGVGSTQYFAGELFRQTAQVDVLHVPHRIASELVTALRQGEVQFSFELIQPVLGLIRSGDLKALAVTSRERMAVLPDVPTMAESGMPDFDVTSWYGLAFPAGTPRPIVDKMNAALRAVLAREDVRRRIREVGAAPAVSSPDEMRAHVVAEIAKWRRVREQAGIPLQ